MKKMFLFLFALLLPIGARAASEPYAVLSKDGKTVTFYYDGNKAKNGGVDIHDDYGSNPYGAVTTAVFDASFADYRPTSTANWFFGCSSLTSITGMENLHTDNVTDFSYMFENCKLLESLDLRGFKTDKATNIDGMFDCCTNLKNIDVSGFKTDNVTHMSGMFSYCSSLTSLDLSSFNTDNVIDISSMFWRCANLTSLDLSSFNTGNVQSVHNMFDGCSNLTTIYVGNGWTTENIEEGRYMFSGCTSLVGGKGTKFDNNHINSEYARIDGGTDLPGYFTDVKDKQGEQKPGDVNGDNNVNVGDIMAVINVMASGTYDKKADVNGDNNVNVGDIMAVINIMAGK